MFYISIAWKGEEFREKKKKADTCVLEYLTFKSWISWNVFYLSLFLFSVDMKNTDSDLLQDILKLGTNNECLFKRRQCPKFILQQIDVSKRISKRVGSCPSTGFRLTYCINVLLWLLLYSKDVIIEGLFFVFCSYILTFKLTGPN